MAPALATLKAEDEGVRSLILEALSIIRSDDFDRYFDLFTDDAVWMLPSSGTDVHMAQARTFYGFTRKFRFDQQCQVEELVVSDDWAFVRLTFDGYLRARFDDSAPPLRSVSRHIWILRKEPDDRWKIARDIWNNPRQTAR